MEMKLKRKYLLMSMLLIVIVALTACGGNDSANNEKKEDNSQSGGLDSSVTLRMLEPGGESGNYVEHGFINAFTEKTGIKVERESPTSLGKLQSVVKAGDTSYNLIEMSASNLEQAVGLGLVEELDWDLINPDPIFDEAKHPYGVGYQYFNTVMAWDSKNKKPETWADFWDTKNFPGKRALPDWASFAIPLALLADGVSPDELYPIDLDRAFKKLEEIKDDVSIWWDTGGVPIQALVNGEVEYAAVWPATLIADPQGLEFTFNQGLLKMAYFAVPKGAKNFEETMAFLHELTKAENQAKAMEIFPYPGPSLNLESTLSDGVAEQLITSDENYPKHVLDDPKWWNENADEVNKRWQEFQLNR